MTFLTETELNTLVEVIQEAENLSTGEIRIHIDANTESNFAQKAWKVFQSLEMQKTQERNGVLFYINFEQKYLTVIGDKGIHQKVHQQFWDDIHDEMTQGFAQQIYFETIKKAILKTGVELKKYFPIKGENPNELPNEITFS